MKRSSLGLDLYIWLVYRTFLMRKPLRLSWRQLYVQFGADPTKADDAAVVNNFRRDALRELRKIRTAWEGFRFSTPQGALVLHPTRPLIDPRA